MKKNFLTGLVIVSPIVITLWLVHLLIHLMTAPFTSIVQSILAKLPFLNRGFGILSSDQILSGLSVIAVIAGILLLLLCIGLISTFLYVHLLVKSVERYIDKIPFVNKIYTVCREFTHVLLAPQSTLFSRVVWAPFPTHEQAVMGLVTNSISITKPDGSLDPFTLVLILGTPHPLQGFVLLCKENTLVPTKITAEHSLKWLISCGSSVPENLAEATATLAKKISAKS